MSDGVNPVESTVRGDTDRGQVLTAGGMLRSAREAAGLHVAALAVSMKVPVKKLEALEADRLDLLPDVVFVRALASSVCRTLKIDPAPVLEKLPRSGAQPLIHDDRVINTPFRTHGEATGLSVPAFLKKPSVLVVLALLVGACVVFYFPELQTGDSAEEAVALPSQPSVEATPSAVQPSADEAVPLAASVSVTETPAAALTVQPATPQVGSSAVVAGASVGETGGKGIVAADTPTDKARDIVAAPSSAGLLLLKARAPSWVQVVDAKGAVQLSRTLVAGESIEVTGVAPLAVVIGRVDSLDVEVRGKPFSLLGIAKDNVARFEVK